MNADKHRSRQTTSAKRIAWAVFLASLAVSAGHAAEEPKKIERDTPPKIERTVGSPGTELEFAL